MYGPYGTLQDWYPPLPTRPPYVFWRYRRIRAQVFEPNPEWTGLDVEDLRSLSWVFAGRYVGDAGDEAGCVPHRLRSGSAGGRECEHW